jgi:hypothetical protein
LKQVALLLSKRNQFSYAVLPVASARHADRRAARRQLLCLTQARHQLLRLAQARHRQLRLAQARHRQLRLRRTTGCLGTSRDSSRGSSRRLPSTTPHRAGSSSTTPPRAGSLSTTPPRAGSSSTTSPTPRVQVPRHVERLVTRLVTLLVIDYSTSRGSSSTISPPPRVRVPRHVTRLVTRLVASLVVDYSTSRRLVVDNSASRRLVVDYFASIARPGALACRAARHVDRRAACRRLLRLRRVPGCLGTSRGSSLVVDYFAYASRSGASARHAARRVVLTNKRRIPLRSASVRTPHLFHHGITKVLVNPRSKGITSVRSTTTH